MRYKTKYKLKQISESKALEFPQALRHTLLFKELLKFFKTGIVIFLFLVFFISNLLLLPPLNFPVGKTIKIDNGLNMQNIKNYLRE